MSRIKYFSMFSALFLAACSTYSQAAVKISNNYFTIGADNTGITGLARTNDKYNTNYIIDKGNLADVVIAYRTDPNGQWSQMSKSSLVSSNNESIGFKIIPDSNTQSKEQVEVRSTLRLNGDSLFWAIDIQNLTDKPLEVGDVGIPLRLNTQYSANKIQTYTLRVMRHFLIAQNGSFVMAMRTNAEPPYLVMIPDDNTRLEYFDRDIPAGNVRGSLCVYIHSKAVSQIQFDKGGNWRQKNTSIILQPRGRKNSSISYGFKFRWADGYDGARQILFEEGKFDVEIVPGMTVPSDLFTLVSLHTKNKIESIVAEFPDKTKIEYQGEKKPGCHIYKVSFSKLGENMLTINYGKDKKMTLEFFVTEPLETVIKKRAAFLVNKQQHRDPNKWYYGVYSDWDMKNHILRSADDRDGLSTWLTDACDDGGNARPAYVASKNVFFPNQSEIASIDLYIKHYLWGGMQQTEDEPYPYGIYGIPNWKQNRESNAAPPNGKTHLWRIYDYPHIVLLYYRMYQIAKFYPEMKMELTKDEYLKRAYKTAVAYFVVPVQTRKWNARNTPTMNEVVMNELLTDLDAEGKVEWAAELRKHWENKVKHFVNDDPYLYGSEFAFDSTGFESTGAMARYAMENLDSPGFAADVNLLSARAFMEKQLNFNVCDRGWLETAYYYLGSDYRSLAGTANTLSYMSQMGGWSILDYALYYAKDPFPYLRLGFASYLSTWALINTGTVESNYGFWYPGPENDGAASGRFEPPAYERGWIGKWNKRGAWFYSAEGDVGYNAGIRTAATIVADDPLFGLIAYGGILKKTNTGIEVIPKDGTRRQFHFIKSNLRLHILPQRDGFPADKPIIISDSANKISFDLESRSKSGHTTQVSISGLPQGDYFVKLNGKTIAQKQTRGLQTLLVDIVAPDDAKTLNVEIELFSKK